MKKLKIFPKMFIQIFSVLGIIIILVHSLVFFIFPKTYLETRKEKIYNIANEISSNMNGKEIKYIEQTLLVYIKICKISYSRNSYFTLVISTVLTPIHSTKDSSNNAKLIPPSLNVLSYSTPS
mgnify:CR=1 FL=1